MKKKIVEHFKKVDPKLHQLLVEIDDYSHIGPQISCDHFTRLCRTIVGQQLSTKAAASIWKRFEKAFAKKKITAWKIAGTDEQVLRDIGMAWSKVRSLKDLSAHVLEKKVVLKNIQNLDDEKIKEMLIAVKGIGPWSIEMFLMFSVGREDYFSFGDLGLIKGVQKLYNLKNKPNEKQLIHITKKWAPYRTYAACILWHHLDNAPVEE